MTLLTKHGIDRLTVGLRALEDVVVLDDIARDDRQGSEATLPLGHQAPQAVIPTPATGEGHARFDISAWDKLMVAVTDSGAAYTHWRIGASMLPCLL